MALIWGRFTGLPHEKIIAAREQRAIIGKNLPSFIESLPIEIKQDARYLSKFDVGAGFGLFDYSLNAIWNEVVLDLHKKMIAYGLDIFYDAAIDGKAREFYQTEDDNPLMECIFSPLKIHQDQNGIAIYKPDLDRQFRAGIAVGYLPGIYIRQYFRNGQRLPIKDWPLSETIVFDLDVTEFGAEGLMLDANHICERVRLKGGSKPCLKFYIKQRFHRQQGSGAIRLLLTFKFQKLN